MISDTGVVSVDNMCVIVDACFGRADIRRAIAGICVVVANTWFVVADIVFMNVDTWCVDVDTVFLAGYAWCVIVNTRFRDCVCRVRDDGHATI